MMPIHLKKISAFCLIALALFAAYSPALLHSYAHHDDYFFLDPNGNSQRAQFSFALGRFFSAFMALGFGEYLSAIGDLTKIRWTVFFLFVLCAFIFYLFVKKYEKSEIHALLLSIVLFTLPPFQIWVAYALNFVNTPSILLGLWAGILAHASWDETKRRPKSGLFALSIFLLVIALSFYPSGAMFYWVIPAVMILQEKYPLREIKRRLTTIFLTGFAGLVIYALVLQITRPHDVEYNAFYNPYRTTTDYAAKLLWFLDVPLSDALNLWNIFPKPELMLLNLSLIFCGLLASAIKFYKSKEKRLEDALFIPLALGLLLLSFLPNLVPAANAPWYRCQTGLMSIVFLFLLRSIKTLLKFIPAKDAVLTSLLILLTAGGIFLSQRTILLYRVIPSRQEIAYYKSNLKFAFDHQIEKIHVIQPYLQANARYDEFVTLSSHYTADFVYMVRAVFMEMTKEEGWVPQKTSFPRPGKMIFELEKTGSQGKVMNVYSIELTYSVEGRTINPPKSVLVLDVPRFIQQGNR